jgi:hypothetical protein
MAAQPTLNPLVGRLEPLIGEWIAEVPDPPGGGQPVRGRVTFEWLQDRSFVVQRWDTPAPFPSGIAVVGPDETGERFLQHYFDARGVSRTYRMSFDAGVRKL